MSEWWTYTLSDLILFSSHAYRRLFELYNASVWPAQLLALAVGFAILPLSRRATRASGRWIAALLAAAWLWVGLAFHAAHYARLNTAAPYFAWAFGIEAALLVGIGIAGGRSSFGWPADAAGRVGLSIYLLALVAVSALLDPAGTRLARFRDLRPGPGSNGDRDAGAPASPEIQAALAPHDPAGPLVRGHGRHPVGARFARLLGRAPCGCRCVRPRDATACGQVRRLLPALAVILALAAARCSSAPPAAAPKTAAAAPPCVGTLGIEAGPISKEAREKLDVPNVVQGALVTNVWAGGPAAAAGIQAGDVVTAVGGAPVDNDCEFSAAAFSRACGPVSVTVRRAGASIELTLDAVAQAPFLAKACQDGSASACFREGWLLWSPTLGPDSARALEIFTTACRGGSADACAYEAIELMHVADTSSSARFAAERACTLNSASGCAHLAFMYATGKLVKKDDGTATTLYRKACDLGDPQGCYNVGLMAQEGRGRRRTRTWPPRSTTRAVSSGARPRARTWASFTSEGSASRRTRRAPPLSYQEGCDGTRCQPSNLSGCVNLGRAYRDGIGVAKEPGEIGRDLPGGLRPQTQRERSRLGGELLAGLLAPRGALSGRRRDPEGPRARPRLLDPGLRPGRRVGLLQRGVDLCVRNGRAGGSREGRRLPREGVSRWRRRGVLRPRRRVREGHRGQEGHAPRRGARRRRPASSVSRRRARRKRARSSARRGSARCRSASGRRPRRRVSSGKSSMRGRTPACAANRRLSSESIEVPEGQPEIERRPKISGPTPNLHRLVRRADDDELAVGTEPADARRHGLGVRDGREDDAGAAELRGARPRDPGPCCRCSRRAPSSRASGLLVRAARDRDGVEAHLRGELDAEVSEAADAEDGDEVARHRAGVAERVEGRDAGVHQRRGVLRTAARRGSGPAPPQGATT